jgi:hypothetical protein
VRAQLIPTLQRVLTHDFPNKWPEFLDITLQLLQTNDATSVFSGIMCLLALCKVYRYKANEVRGDFDKVVSVSFPLLLNIGNGLINETSLEAGEMLRMILKAYKLAIYVSKTASDVSYLHVQFELPVPLREHEAMVGWCTLFLNVVSKQPPESAMLEDIEDREKNHWWKAKKWAYANLNRLFIR